MQINGGNLMKTFIALLNLTEQGIANIKSSPDRAGAFAKEAEKSGIKVKDTYWTLGHYDGVLIFDAPDEETATAALLTLGMAKNIRTQTLRAFNRSDITAILDKLS
jgi:uncharacterized protein with GYD domain